MTHPKTVTAIVSSIRPIDDGLLDLDAESKIWQKFNANQTKIKNSGNIFQNSTINKNDILASTQRHLQILKQRG